MAPHQPPASRAATDADSPRRAAVAEVVRVFLWLGSAGLGGPAAHLALMEAEIVRRRQWLPAGEFLDLLGLTNLIPGPNSTELAMALGHRRAGWAGLVAGGLSFIVPAACITGVLAWAYVRFGTRPDVMPWLAGLAPAVVGVIAGATVTLARAIVTDARKLVIAVAALVAALAGVNEVVVLLGGGVLGLVVFGAVGPRALTAAVALMVALGSTVAADGAAPVARASLGAIAAFFLRTGSVLYGGGYVLAALLQPLVSPLGWLSTRELLDAVAAGQVTPGPVLTTATFVGYLLHGGPGAVVATLAIFLPAFVGVGVLVRILPRLRRWRAARRFLDGVSASAWALVAATAVTLGHAALVTPAALTVAAAAAAAMVAGVSAGLVVLMGLAGGALWYGLSL